MKKLLQKLKGLLPVKLPTKGLKDFDDWALNIFTTYNLPDMPSYRNALASMIMHLGPNVDRKAPFYFAKAVRKAMANQIAYEKIQQLKKQEQEYIDATLAKPVEAENTDGASVSVQE